ncbi:branched-chain amino acid ABC transporter permease [Sphaerobacter thermophilus]|jgi:branched-chain amino acid transport system permease protein|uniref:Inner-membrane translocator n=1 Tax=Sphaerobacter thermophilus (strain ATCC 49802 / DSM 20745 / KCCM 41009 / NCIMB 13125 / S 6022) TaxID=479434 RepID=D1C6F2_SPHTD|nr:branched-chain amino acid ABC transporter permease [Sphaerobacter thermophilus]ACZ39577.1 inner-membrane translocator [Sphaerobacter thermophilus DSM 20745]PZN65974.1 MAG: branched-chain amino acid ABC transporter permease [Sphaerobacter thermophilus]
MKEASKTTKLIVAAVTVAMILLPLIHSGGSVTAVIGFLVPFVTTVAILAIIAIGLNVQWGYTGIFNFGVVGFFMVGAFVAAIVTKSPADSEFVQYVGGFGDRLAFLPFLDSREWLPFIFGVLAAALASALLALLLALSALRLREDYLAITTIGVAEVLRRVTIEETWLVNGTRGLTGIPRPLAGWFEPNVYRFVFLGLALAMLFLVYLMVERGISSPWGRVLRALREDEDVVAASGKNVFAFKVQGFVLGAAIMGAGGAFFAFQQGAISPETFTHFFGTFIIWAMLVLGGSGNNVGAVVGTFVVWGFWSITLQIQSFKLPVFIVDRISFFRDFIIGALIVVVLLAGPKGLVPERARVSRWLDSRVRELRRQEAATQATATVEPASSPVE